ncbi:hypothetical protein D3C78_1635130 [compost metagenome]
MSSTIEVTRTPATCGMSALTGVAVNTAWRPRNGSPVELVALSALAILLATRFRRIDCAVSAEPAILKTLDSDMVIAHP